MGSRARIPPSEFSEQDDSDVEGALGDVLSGRFADVSIDSVDAVRDVRERE